MQLSSINFDFPQAHLRRTVKKSSFKAASECYLVDKWHKYMHAGFEH